MLYQPEWRDGKTVGVSKRDAASRADAIVEYLGDAKGLRILDLGAYAGYFSHRLADQLDSECVAVDDFPGLKEAPGVTVIRERLTPAAIEKLGKFDVALCLSVLHHLPQWKRYLKTLTDIADVVFVETSVPEEILVKAKAHGSAKAIHEAVEAASTGVIAHTAGYGSNPATATLERPLWVIDQR